MVTPVSRCATVAGKQKPDEGYMPRTVTLIRHGQSEHNAAVLAGAVGDPGFFDARLTAMGEAQVVTLAAQMAAVRVEAVIVSPLTRALQTAWGAFGGNEPTAPFQVDAMVRERLENSCDVGRAPGKLSADFPALDFGHWATFGGIRTAATRSC